VLEQARKSMPKKEGEEPMGDIIIPGGADKESLKIGE